MGMEEHSLEETESGSSSSKKPKWARNTFFIVLAASIAIIATSIVIVSNAWTEMNEAKSKISVAEDNLADANSSYASADRYYDDALSEYSAWYSCYITTSWRWDWLCGSETVVSTNLDVADTLLAAAEREQNQATISLSRAKSTYNDLAEQFNQSAWIWGGLSGLALISTIVFGVLFGLQSRKQRKVEEIEARPDWDCPECSSHNEGGMFCVSCGFAKSELKATQTKKSKASQATTKDEESHEKSEAQSED
jgi:hypothetical protein